jgi:hypothetical protein
MATWDLPVLDAQHFARSVQFAAGRAKRGMKP